MVFSGAQRSLEVHVGHEDKVEAVRLGDGAEHEISAALPGGLTDRHEELLGPPSAWRGDEHEASAPGADRQLILAAHAGLYNAAPV